MAKQFIEELNQNTREATVLSLLKTLSEDPARTVGEITDALGEDTDTDYMLETFRSLKLQDIADALVAQPPVNGKKKPAAKASAEAIEVEEAEPTRKRKKGKGKGKKGKKGKGKTKAQDKRAAAEKAPKKGGGSSGGATKGAVRRVLKRSEEMLTVSDIAKELDVESDDIKPLLTEMLEDETIVKEGKARGTRYAMA